MILNAREMAIAKIAWSQGYGHGHNHTVEGHYAPPDEYDYDTLHEQLAEGVFDGIPERQPTTPTGQEKT